MTPDSRHNIRRSRVLACYEPLWYLMNYFGALVFIEHSIEHRLDAG